MNTSFHDLDTRCLHRQWRMFRKIYRKNNQSTIVFLSLVGFLGYQLHLQQGLIVWGNIHAWEMPLGSSLPVLIYCLAYIHPSAWGFFCQTRMWILCFLSPPPSHTMPTSISFSTLMNRHPTLLLWFKLSHSLRSTQPLSHFSFVFPPCSRQGGEENRKNANPMGWDKNIQ